ncbi:TetR/AcrR family transcriptional regulator [Brevundimonas sp. A19_0]|uniref:TetR/AcrR family transcriptional regulator n=1 Tax=Brevundimonas sp. A19_0 TaxID=2821087 RepID=UPI001ADD38C4|nr:TetR/AcrR family transcriptional regulator [Brevundimonas sp. A19_0]MBO9501727.1 TetR/AcrR family transcriptional regulator [Brevundimonas sp. A19_0]
MTLAQAAPSPSGLQDGDTEDPRRRAILIEARRHFMAQGFASTRIEPIAREASVSTATLYTFFSSKADLFRAVIDDTSDEFVRQMDEVRALDGPARCQLTRFSEAYVGFMADPLVTAVFRLVLAERTRFQEMALHFYERGKARIGVTLVEAIEALCQRGELVCDKPSWAAGQLMGMLEHPVFFVPMVTGDSTTVQRSHTQIAADAVQTFLARYGGPNLDPAAPDLD